MQDDEACPIFPLLSRFGRTFRTREEPAQIQPFLGGRLGGQENFVSRYYSIHFLSFLKQVTLDQLQDQRPQSIAVFSQFRCERFDL